MSSFIAMSLRRLHYHRLTALSPSVSRSFCTAGYPFDKDYTKNNSGVAENVWGSGRESSDIKLVNDSYYAIRFDVPGLTASDLTLWLDDKKDILFEGIIKSEPKYDSPGGFYEAKFPGCPLFCNMDKMEFELKHGVLWITLPLKEDHKKLIKMKHDFIEKGLL